MNCPECNIEMFEGEFRFFGHYEFRLIFSPKNIQAPPGIRRFSPVFIKLEAKQNEIKFKSPGLYNFFKLQTRPYVKSSVYNCINCKLIVVEDHSTKIY